ncbi:zona pellucida-like domain-containing protein 1 [Rhinophrynus dorsalis]
MTFQILTFIDSPLAVDNSDIIVNCGAEEIVLSINACPVYYADFDPLLMALNGKYNISKCIGSLIDTTDPPVIKYVFPINDTSENTCGNSIVIEDSSGSGIFSQYSKVQTVVISGIVITPVTSETGLISYSTNLSYNFSCRYPLQYLLNNTNLLTSSANVAINTNNGSFISTLSMQLFLDGNFTSEFNGSALPLKRVVYVQVSATNLTANFNVLLDECFATPTPLVTTAVSDKFNLLTGCNPQNKTIITSNGIGKSATFSFETFRFLQHSNQQISTIYLHCITRLCQPDQCGTFLSGCPNVTTSSRKKRAADTQMNSEGTTEPVTVSSGPIYTKNEGLTEAKQLEGTLTGLIVGLIIAAILGAALIFSSVLLYKMYQLRALQTEKNGVDNFTFNGK